MSRPALSPVPPSSSAPDRRRKHRLGPGPPRGWEATEDEGWAYPPSPRRSRWEEPGSEEPPAEMAAGLGGRRPRSRPAGGLWDRPDSQRPRGSPPREADWEGGGSLGEPRRQWGPGLGGGRWSSPQRAGGGGRRSPSPGLGVWDSPDAPGRQQSPDGEPRGWGSPGREENWEHARIIGRPAWEQRQGSPGGAGGRWGSAGRRREESPSPGREHSWGSPGRDLRREHNRSSSGWSQPSREQAMGSPNGTGGRWGRTERRGREHHSPPRKQSGWSSPKREGRQERPGSTRHSAREQSQVNPHEERSRWSSAWCREGNSQGLSRDEGRPDSLKREWQSPSGEARGWGGPMRYRGGGGGGGGEENVRETGAEEESHERGREETGAYAASSGSPEPNASPTHLVSGSFAVPEEWTPCDSVVRWWMRCRRNLRNTAWKHQKSIWPRPTLPGRSSETPQVNPGILSLLNKKQETTLQRATWSTRILLNEVLDMLAPAMTICEMAEEAMEKADPVDPMELREWAHHLIRFIVSINHMLTLQYRYQVLGAINLQLRSVMSQMRGQSTEGLLFAKDKEKLLKEIIMRFPQLSETTKKKPRRRYRPNTQAAKDKQAQGRPWLGSHSKPLGTGSESSQEGTANPGAEQSHSPGAEGQGPAEWR